MIAKLALPLSPCAFHLLHGWWGTCCLEIWGIHLILSWPLQQCQFSCLFSSVIDSSLIHVVACSHPSCGNPLHEWAAFHTLPPSSWDIHLQVKHGGQQCHCDILLYWLADLKIASIVLNRLTLVQNHNYGSQLWHSNDLHYFKRWLALHYYN